MFCHVACMKSGGEFDLILVCIMSIQASINDGCSL